MRKRALLIIVHLVLLTAISTQVAALANCADDSCPNTFVVCGPGCLTRVDMDIFYCCCTRITEGGCCQYLCGMVQCFTTPAKTVMCTMFMERLRIAIEPDQFCNGTTGECEESGGM